jgi:hypothetical protein
MSAVENRSRSSRKRLKGRWCERAYGREERGDEKADDLTMMMMRKTRQREIDDACSC